MTTNGDGKVTFTMSSWAGQLLIACLTMLGSIGGIAFTFQGRVSTVEEKIAGSARRIESDEIAAAESRREILAKLDRIESQLAEVRPRGAQRVSSQTE